MTRSSRVLCMCASLPALLSREEYLRFSETSKAAETYALVFEAQKVSDAEVDQHLTQHCWEALKLLEDAADSTQLPHQRSGSAMQQKMRRISCDQQ